MDLLKQQSDLQAEGNLVLKELDLVNYLSKFGTTIIGGSLITGLMTWRDIDVGVITQPEEEKMWEAAKHILNLPGITQVTLIINTDKHNPNRPTGLYIGAKYKEGNNVWKLDIWFVEELEGTVIDKWLKEKLNDEYREIILRIKSAVMNDKRYCHQFFSVDIYKAVIDHGVKNLESFKDYLKNQKNIDL